MEHPDTKAMQSAQKALGERVRMLRTKNGWASPEDFAGACRISPSHLLQVERGEGTLTISVIAVIAENLKTTVSELLEGIV